MIRSAYRDDFRLISRIIEVLKSGDVEAIKKIQDVTPPKKLHVSNLPSYPEPQTGKERVGAPEGESPLTSNDESAEVIQPPPASKNRQSTKGKDRNAVVYEPDDLRGIIARGRLSTPSVKPYQSLLDAGYIKSSAEYL
jgi:hypothetical protein